MIALAKLLLLAFVAGALGGAGWKLASLLIDDLRLRLCSRRVEQHRDKAIAQLQQLATAASEAETKSANPPVRVEPMRFMTPFDPRVN
jgi:hypothetical protein